MIIIRKNSHTNKILLMALLFASSFWSFSIDAQISFTDSQATAGETVYEQSCASCHGANLEGLGVVPGIAGQGFMAKWNGQSLLDLSTQLKRMPPDAPDSLGETGYTNLLAYVLHSNGIAAGNDALNVAAIASGEVPQVDSGPALSPTVLEVTGESELLDNLSSVTPAMRINPSQNDWTSWGRSSNSHGFSPLDQINRDTVSSLEESWRLSLPAGNNNPTPLIHDGVMFFYTFPDTVMAIDASNGVVLWRYQHQASIPSTRKLGIALHEDKIIVPTSDMRMLALNAKTGELIWNQEIETQLEVFRDVAAYDLRAAPLIAGDKIIQGVVGSLVSTGAFIFAMDVNTGEELWRFHTLSRPGELGGNTWNDLPLDERHGGSVWIPGSYDPELNLAYFGVAPTYHTQPLTHSINRDGINNDALFTNSTLALNPDTGELVWYYQHMPNDQWDLDWAFERQIVQIPFRGENVKAVVNVGKTAILEALDAATGEYLFSMDMGLQNIISYIDPVTGAKTINPDTIPRREGAYNICPTAVGARSWPPSAYNPESGRLFVPLVEGCFKAGSEGSELLLTGIPVTLQAHPESSDGNMGRLQVLNLKTQEMEWRYRQQTSFISSILATGGGVIFSGDLDPSMKAFDEATGELLWETVLSDNPSSSIVTYAIDGRQYIAVVVGQSNNHVRDWSRMGPAYAAMEGWDVETPPSREGPAILVFALAE